MSFQTFPPEILDLIARKILPRDFTALVIAARLEVSEKFYWKAHARRWGLVKKIDYRWSCYRFYYDGFLDTIASISLRELTRMCRELDICLGQMHCAKWTLASYRTVEALVSRKLIDVDLHFGNDVQFSVGGVRVVMLKDEIRVNGEIYAYPKRGKKLIAADKLDSYLLSVLEVAMNVMKHL